MPEVEKKFNFSGKAEERSIAGFSMGGWGAMYYALKYPASFSFVWGMSVPVDGRNHPLTPNLFKLIDLSSPEILPSLHFDIGSGDQFVEINLETQALLKLFQVPNEFILREGGHNSRFWAESLILLFSRLSKEIH